MSTCYGCGTPSVDTDSTGLCADCATSQMAQSAWPEQCEIERPTQDRGLQSETERLRGLVDACAIYLKEDETPAQRIERERADTEAVLKLLLKEKRYNERLRGLLREWLNAGRDKYDDQDFVKRVREALGETVSYQWSTATHPYPRERTWSDCEAEVERLRHENSQWQSACAGYTEALAARDRDNAALLEELARIRDQIAKHNISIKEAIRRGEAFEWKTLTLDS